MRSGSIFVFLICSFWATGTDAGAWLREKGTSFTSVSFTSTWFRDTTNTSYLEYGWRDDLTIGTDIGYATSSQGTQSGYGTIFVRRPLGKNNGPNKWAYELGVGAAWVDYIAIPYLKTGVSWGRGFTFRDTPGWASVDASVSWALTTSHHLAKVDTTVGLNFTSVTTGMLQLYLAHLDRETYASIAPSVVIKPRNAKYRLQIGADSQLGNPEYTAIKIGLWREF
ncbi:hypothetical protein [Sulfitobacter sp. MF3-043]|uniref:hypothetical protein n=1 Tax=Sulfitobacter sediminivivens TaxID=3252902 RepID=UPI0036DAF03D